MGKKKVWFITGAGRGMGVDFARAALADGHAVVAAGRDTGRVSRALLGHTGDLLAVKLDVTSRPDAGAAVRAAIDRFGRIDVLVNNAASFHAGYFEELSPEQMDRQLATSLLGPMNVTRAVLLVKQPPLRFIAGSDAIATAEQTIATLRQQIEAFRGLSTSLAFAAFDEPSGADGGAVK